ncbi:MAG: carboxypeptidase-like regulatory domain-containing protein, partial [Acidobacteriota bacterium]
MRIYRHILLLWCLAILPLVVAAQTVTTSTVSGTVLDPQGSAVTAAIVTLTDIATNQERTTITDGEGRYSFYALTPGVFKVRIEKEGFKTVEVSQVQAELSKAATINVRMELGEILLVQNIVAKAQSQLQTADASIGGVFGEESLKRLPNITRQADTLFNLQPATTMTGEFAGARRDQSTVILDGVDVSDNVLGEQRPTIPVPVESIKEYRVIVANASATFVPSSGGHIVLVTKSGTNEYHGSAYLYHADAALAANSWTNNRVGIARPFLLDNRFGASFGGPIIKNRTFLFANYEGRRHPDSVTVTRTVPLDSLRVGTVFLASADLNSNGIPKKVKLDAAAIKQLDPRGLGPSPKILEYLRLYPPPNDFMHGDRLGRGDDAFANTAGYTFAPQVQTSDNFGVLRLDHKVDSQWNVSGKFSADRQLQTDARQVDLIRKIATYQSPQRPRNAVATVTGVLTPRLTNEARFSWLHNHQEQGGIEPQTFVELNAPIMLGNTFGITASTFLDDLIDVDAQRARRQSRSLNIYQWSDTLAWVKGKHSLQIGGDLRRIRALELRNNKGSDVLTTPVAHVNCSSSDIKRPDKLDPVFGFSAFAYYTGILTGELCKMPVLVTRDANLNLQPFGTGFSTRSTFREWAFFFSDSWKWKPSLTLTYGLTYGWGEPPVEDSGKQTVLAFKDTGKLVNYRQYFRDKLIAAEAGKVYNPDLAYVPLRQAGRNRAYNTDHTNFSPRLSVAWNPALKKGWPGWLFGNQKTVMRGGYSLVYDRTNTTQTIALPPLGVGFTQTFTLGFPRNAEGRAFRIGNDGPIPFPKVPAQLIPPIVPNKPFSESFSFTVDPFIKVPRNHVVDFTIQRELPRDLLLEVGFIGRFARGLYVNGNLNSVPIMHKDPVSGQTFAQAFDAIAAVLHNSFDERAVTPQPYFENLYGQGATKRLLSGATNKVYFLAGDANAVQRILDMEGHGPILTNLQVEKLLVRTSGAISNYHAMFLSVRKQFGRGLVFDFSYTLSKSLDQSPISTQNELTPFMSSFFPDIDYGPSLFDIRHLFKAHAFYQLPFGQGRLRVRHAPLNRFISGWFTAGIFTSHSGLPLTVTQTGNSFGGGGGELPNPYDIL